MANGSFILDFLLEHKENVFFETEHLLMRELEPEDAGPFLQR